MGTLPNLMSRPSLFHSRDLKLPRSSRHVSRLYYFRWLRADDPMDYSRDTSFDLTPPIRIPQRVSKSSLAGMHLDVPAFSESGEHLVRLGDAERGLKSGAGGRYLAASLQRLQKLLLLAVLVRQSTPVRR